MPLEVTSNILSLNLVSKYPNMNYILKSFESFNINVWKPLNSDAILKHILDLKMFNIKGLDLSKLNGTFSWNLNSLGILVSY